MFLSFLDRCGLCPCQFSTSKQAVVDIWVNSYRCILIRFYWEKQNLFLGSQDDKLTSTDLSAYAGFIKNSLLTILIFFHLSSEDIHTLWQHSTAVLSCVFPNLCRSIWLSLDYFVVLTCPNWWRSTGKAKTAMGEDMSCHLGTEAIFTQHSSYATLWNCCQKKAIVSSPLCKP